MSTLRWILFGIASVVLHAQDYCAPAALAVTRDAKTLYIGCAAGRRVEVFDLARGKVLRQIAMPSPVGGLALSSDETRLYVTCTASRSTVQIVESDSIIATIPAGHTTVSPVPSPDGRWLYVCNQFNNNVAVIDLAARKEIARIPVAREPVSAALTPDGKLLLVANALPATRSDQSTVAAEVSLIDTGSERWPRASHCPTAPQD